MTDGIANYTGYPAVEAPQRRDLGHRCRDRRHGAGAVEKPDLSLLGVMLNGMPMESVRANIAGDLGRPERPRDASPARYALLTIPISSRSCRAARPVAGRSRNMHAGSRRSVRRAPDRKPWRIRDVVFEPKSACS
jgi:hypothetical protein